MNNVRHLVILIFFCFPIFAQEEDQTDKIKRNNITVQAGFPMLTGLNYEYRLPLLNNKLAPEADFGIIPFSSDGYSTTATFYAIGLNYYFLNKFEPLYVGFNYGSMPIHTTELDGETVDESIQFQTLNSKLGLNLGQSVFFRFEIGYSLIFYNIDEANDYLSESYGVRIKPSLDFLQLPNLKLGVGVKF
jgi:hypothetical protein